MADYSPKYLKVSIALDSSQLWIMILGMMSAPPTTDPLNTVLPNQQDTAKSRAEQVQQMFDRISGTYDRLNDCISMGMHRSWKKEACRKLQLKPGSAVLDVCTGTGDLVQYLIPLIGSNGSITGLDFSNGMLEVARERFKNTQQPKITFQQGDALALPYPDNHFDGTIISFGLRNVVDIKGCLAEMARVTKPGGWIVNVDTCPDPSLPGFKFYFANIMPLMGRLFSSDQQAYQYLQRSTDQFLPPEKLAQVLSEIGLQQCQAKRLGFGSVGLVFGQKAL